MKKTSTIALVLKSQDDSSVLIDTLSDEKEILFLEQAIRSGEINPLKKIYSHRDHVVEQDSAFGDYVEDLLSKPFLATSVQLHGVRWLKSKLKIEQYEKTEKEAARVIAQYALKIFEEDPSKTDFFLAGPHSQVRIRIFHVDETEEDLIPSSKAG